MTLTFCHCKGVLPKCHSEFLHRQSFLAHKWFLSAKNMCSQICMEYCDMWMPPGLCRLAVLGTFNGWRKILQMFIQFWGMRWYDLYIFVPFISDLSRFSLMMSRNKSFPFSRVNTHFCGFCKIKLFFANSTMFHSLHVSGKYH